MENRDPHVEELKKLPLGACKAILTMAASPSETNENIPCPKISYTIGSPEFLDWKLVTKKSQGATTFPCISEGHNGIQQLSFVTFEILSFKQTNKNIQYTLEKIGKTEK